MDELKPTFSEQIIALSHKYRNPILASLVALVVGLVSVYGYHEYKNSYERSAVEKLYEAEKLSQQNAVTNPQEKVDVSSTIVKLKNVLEKYPKSIAALQASITLADLYITQNESDKAIETLESVLKSFSNNTILSNTLRLKLTNIYETKNDCQKITSTLKPVVDSKEHSQFKPEALLRVGLCQEALGLKDDARATYQRLSSEFVDTNQGQQALKYLKIMGTNS